MISSSVFGILCLLSCLPYYFCKEKQNSCRTEHSTLILHNKKHEIVWKSKTNLNYSVVFSDPPCLDEYNNVIVRICANGAWLVSKSCVTVEENTRCPPNFVQKGKTCTYTTEPRPWNEGCWYPGSSSNFKETAWLPVMRRSKFEFFEYAYPGEKYGSVFLDENSSESDEFYSVEDDANCAILGRNGIQLKNCNSRFPHFCSYKHEHFLYNCPANCVAGGLGSNYCFCKVFRNVTNLSRNAWCEQLAVPKYSYERTTLQKLAGSNICWIGDLGIEHFRPNLYLAVSKNSWSLEEDGTLICSLCKVPAISPPKVDMVLKFSPQKHKMFLNVYSPEGLLNTDDEDAVYCFTDATGMLKTRVDVDEIWDSIEDSHSSTRLKVFKVSIANHYPGYYWCEAFQLPNVTLITSNRVIGHKELKGHEYTLRIKIRNYCRFLWFNLCRNPTINKLNALGRKVIFSERCLSRFVKTVRLYHIFNITEDIDILLHLSTESRLPLKAEYFTLRGCLEHLKSRYWNYVSITYFRSSEFCLEEKTVISNNRTINWKTSALGKVIIPEEVCVQENGTPVRRLCQGDFTFGAEWAKIEGICSDTVMLSSRTEILHSYLNSIPSPKITKTISNLTENVDDLTVLDLRYLAEVLSKVSPSNHSCSDDTLDDFIQIIDNLMSSESTILKRSQSLLNVTDEILDVFENTLFCLNITTESYLMRKNNLVIQISKPFQGNISGILLYSDDPEDNESFSDLKIKPIHANIQVEDLLEENTLEVAVYVPEYLLSVIAQNISESAKRELTIIITVFSKDNFFNSDTNDTVKTVSSRIVSVAIPDYGIFLKTPLPVLFKSRKNHNDNLQECAFWNYGDNSETHTGYWSTLGGTYRGHLANHSALEMCYFSHLTNFALLVMNEPIFLDEEPNVSYDVATEEKHDKILTLISDVGCSLSVIGIAGILATSIVFKSWREKVGTRILIQLCVTILLQIILLNLADLDSTPTYQSCTVLGVLLHYVIIAEFSWMLVAAILQFLRFVRVIGPIPNRLFLKTMLIGWGLPLFPVLIVCLVDLDTYATGPLGFCYPTGLSLYLSILLPVTLIVIINLGIFVIVIRNVFILRVETHGKSQILLKRQLCLAILLFFLLGLPWTFGLLAEVIGNDSFFSYIFIYLFCILATLQGFVLFVFYIILEKSTRNLWYNLLKRFLGK